MNGWRAFVHHSLIFMNQKGITISTQALMEPLQMWPLHISFTLAIFH